MRIRPRTMADMHKEPPIDQVLDKLEAKHDSRSAPCSASIEIATALAVEEVERATRKFPTWPTDPLHALAVLGEEFGELSKEVVQLTYEPHKSTLGRVREEAIQTAAMALRFLASLDRYEFTKREQHSQQNAGDSRS